MKIKSVIILLVTICCADQIFSPRFAFGADCPTNGQISDCCRIAQNNTTYTLTRDLTLTGSSSCMTVAPDIHDIVLDLGNHTITYDTAPVTDILNASFETASSGNQPSNWNMSNAPSAARYLARGTANSFYRFGGDYVIKFPVGDYTNPQYIQSDLVHLDPNIIYGVHVLYKSSRYERDRVFLNIPQIANSCSAPTVGNAGTETSWGWTYCEFTTAVPLDVNVQVGLRGAAISTDIYMDMLELRPARPTSLVSFSPPNGHDLNNVTIRNGSLIQGNAKTFGAVEGSPVLTLSRIQGGRVHNLKITASGTQRTGIGISYSNNVEIDHNEVKGLGTYGRKRDQLMAMIAAHYMNDALSIHDNTIYAFQTGIKFTGSNNSIFNNTFEMSTNLSNSYAISVRGDPRGDATNSRIYGNIIRGIGRGMHLTPSSGLDIYNNNIDLMEYPNPEFWEWDRYDSGHCVQGLKFENEVINANVHNNYVRTSQINGTYGGCSLNMNLSQPAGFVSNTTIENNDFVNETFQPEKLTGAAVPAYLLEIDNPSKLVIRNNRFSTNSRGTFYLDAVFGLSFFDNQLSYTGPSSYEHFFLHNTHGGNLARVSNIGFYNTTVSSMNLARPHSAGGAAWNYYIGWNLDVRAVNSLSQAISGADVSITRVSDGALVYTGISDAGGYVRTSLPQYEIAGTGSSYTQNAKSPYNISVTLPNRTNLARQVDLNTNKEEIFVFTGASTGGDGIPPAAPQGLQVQ